MLLLGWCASPKGKHKLAEIVAQKRFAFRPVIATNFTSNFPIINFRDVNQVEKNFVRNFFKFIRRSLLSKSLSKNFFDRFYFMLLS